MSARALTRVEVLSRVKTGTLSCEHNVRFAQAPASAEDFHRRVPSRTTLDRVFQLEAARVLSNDWVVRYDTRYLQVARQSGHAPARSTVVVREARDGAIELRPARPSADHPWRRDTRAIDRERALCGAAQP